MKKNIVVTVLLVFSLLTWIVPGKLHAQCLEDFSLDKVVLDFGSLSDDVKAALSDYYFCESISQGNSKMCDNIPAGGTYKQDCYNDYKGRDVLFMKWASKADYTEADVGECISRNYLNPDDATQRRGDCADLLAVYFGKDSSLCAKETDLDIKASCESIFYRDGSRCDGMANPDSKSSCQARAKLFEVLRSGNGNLCLETPVLRDNRRWYYLCEVFFSKSCERPLQGLKRSYCSSLESKKGPLPVSPDGSAGNE